MLFNLHIADLILPVPLCFSQILPGKVKFLFMPQTVNTVHGTQSSYSIHGNQFSPYGMKKDMQSLFQCHKEDPCRFKICLFTAHHQILHLLYGSISLLQSLS